MKQITENSEVFSAYAQIDLLMIGLQKLQEEREEFLLKRSGIEIIVDKSTGFEKAKETSYYRDYKGYLEKMIPLFRFIQDEERAKSTKEVLDKINEELSKGVGNSDLP